MWKGLLAALAFTVALHGQAAAQDAERAQLAREFVTILQVEETVGGLFDALSPMMASGAAQSLNLSAAESARLGELLAEEFRAGMPEVINQLTNSYAERLTAPQLREIVTFLRSPSGQAMLQSQEEVEQDLQRVGQAFGMRAVLGAMVRLNAERQQRGARQP